MTRGSLPITGQTFENYLDKTLTRADAAAPADIVGSLSSDIINITIPSYNLISPDMLTPNNSSTRVETIDDETIKVTTSDTSKRLVLNYQLEAGKTYYFNAKCKCIEGDGFGLRWSIHAGNTTLKSGNQIKSGEGTIMLLYTANGTETEIRLSISLSDLYAGQRVVMISDIMLAESTTRLPYIKKKRIAYDEVARQTANENSERIRTILYRNDFVEEENSLVEAVINDIDDNSIVFAVTADHHYNSYDWKDKYQPLFARRIAAIAKKVGADFITTLGDLIDGYNDELTLPEYRQQYVNAMRIAEMVDAYTTEGVPFMYVAGHHESFPIDEYSRAMRTLENGEPFVQNRAFTTNDIEAITFGSGVVWRYNNANNSRLGYRGFKDKIKDIDSSTEYSSGKSMTYYVDIQKGSNTVRFVMVDGTHFTGGGYHPDTVAFVSETLVDAKNKGYSVVIFNHLQLKRNAYYNANETEYINEDSFINAINNSGANVLAYIHGHTHQDSVIMPTDTYAGTSTAPYYGVINYPMVGILCQKIYSSTTKAALGTVATYTTRNVNDYDAYVADFVVLHTDTGRLNFFRFGAGDNSNYPTRTIN